MSSLAINHLAEEERAGCFTLVMFLVLCGYLFSVSILHGVISLSVVVTFPGHIFWYSLDFCYANCINIYSGDKKSTCPLVIMSEI